MIGLFIGLNPSIPSSLPTSSKMYDIGEENTRYLVDEVIKDSSITERVYILVKNLLKNGGTSQMVRVNTDGLKWIATDITIGSGSEFHIHMIA